MENTEIHNPNPEPEPATGSGSGLLGFPYALNPVGISWRFNNINTLSEEKKENLIFDWIRWIYVHHIRTKIIISLAD